MEQHHAAQQTVVETAKALPAVTGATVATLTLNEWVAVATFFYITIQAAYLVWKWRKEWKKSRA